MKKLLVLILVTFPVTLITGVCAQGIITTIAGNGIQGFTGDGGPALLAELYAPEGVCTDAYGNVFIADYDANRVRKVSSTDTITTIAGNGTASFTGDGGLAIVAGLSAPVAITIAPSGNLYITDAGNNAIRMVTQPGGFISTVAGNGLSGFSGDGGQATSAELYLPQHCAFDKAGNMYITDTYHNRIRLVSTSGIISTLAGNGNGGYTGDGGSPIAAEIGYPWGIALDAIGNVYFSDIGNSVIRKITISSGTISTIAGTGTAGYNGDNIPAFSAQLNQPAGIVRDASDNLYIAELAARRIRMISASGIITTYAGIGTNGFSGDGGPATAAELDLLYDVALDAAGNMYVADAYRVRKINSTTGIISLANSAAAEAYPNPANNLLTVQLPANAWGATSIYVYDLAGKMVLSNEYKQAPALLHLDISSLP